MQPTVCWRVLDKHLLPLPEWVGSAHDLSEDLEGGGAAARMFWAALLPVHVGLSSL